MSSCGLWNFNYVSKVYTQKNHLLEDLINLLLKKKKNFFISSKKVF